MIAPSGEQIEIAVGDQQAVVVEVGGGLRAYSAGGRQLVDGYRAEEMSSSARGQVLIPWPNRLQDGRYDGPGYTAIEIAKWVGPSGHVHALDIISDFVSRSRKNANVAGVGDRITAHQCD